MKNDHEALTSDIVFKLYIPHIYYTCIYAYYKCIYVLSFPLTNRLYEKLTSK